MKFRWIYYCEDYQFYPLFFYLSLFGAAVLGSVSIHAGGGIQTAEDVAQENELSKISFKGPSKLLDLPFQPLPSLPL